MAELEAIKATIRKLRERTVSRGCSEAAAATALGKVAELMRRNGLDELDLEMAEVVCARPAPLKAHIRDRLIGMVALCTNTVATKDCGRGTVTFSGPAHLAEIAAYTRDMLEAGIDREVRLFRRSTAYKRKRTQRAKARATKAFVEGMVLVLSRRLWAAFEGQQNDAIAERSRAWRDRRHPNLTKAGAPKPTRDPRATSWGAAAAAGVELAAGVGADRRDGALGAPQRLLGRR
ncbi:Protein of unknown function [Tistlia consotensis]|uniref:Uncharacterized protein n=1 Tax=Tistlia consotensis USBA 355 TaxID=560819 RepID=A0A1Y6CQ77_9PROT|nr:DUF2786 domain-containing protein [Tistlia consotensis]SMF82943.1 Protein of unknown function [Tistlia consotensis USBA 355]SNS31458.1 Protein of unknown function [Tistlia consotensis]